MARASDADGLTVDNTLTVGGALTHTAGIASGTALKPGGLANASVAASTAITGATETEANFDTTYSLPANSLTAGAVYHIYAMGIHTATTSTETHTILLKLGSTTLASITGIDPANNDIFIFDFYLTCRTAGASGTVVGSGFAAQGVPQTATDNGATVKPLYLASTTVDTTGALTIAAAIDRQSTATDSDSARLDQLIVHRIG